MSHSVRDEFENANVENIFAKEMEDWRSKMVKVCGDQHPYTFYVTSGHDFEDMILKIVDQTATEREAKKREPFQNLEKMSDVDQEAEKEFHAILSEMEKEWATTELKEALEQKKRECAEVFRMYDKIVSACEDYFEMEHSDCTKRMEKQVNLQEPTFREVEQFLAEIEDFGYTEIHSLRNRISQWIYNKGSSMLEDIDKSYKWLSNQPFAMSVWSDCSATLTSKEVRNAFLTDQRDMNNMWNKAFDDLIMLSAKLEECRCNYNLMKSKFEREIFWMSREYMENMPQLTKIQRRLANFVDKKATLKREIKSLENEISKELQKAEDVQSTMNKKITSIRTNNRFYHEAAIRKCERVTYVMKERIHTYLGEILNGDQFIHEEILGVTWNSVDASHLKPIDDRESVLDGFSNELSKSSEADNEDNFSSAFNVLVSSDNFVTLLNTMSEELGYMLDFSWVNYVKEKLNLVQEIKWIELFKVFKINFNEMRKLKKHMKSYSKLNNNCEPVVNIDQALDGFVSYVLQKRQSSSKTILPPVKTDPIEYEIYLSSVKDLIPKSLLWENVEDQLFQYWQALEMRSTLLKEKSKLIAENSEFENYLENYRKYGIYNL